MPIHQNKTVKKFVSNESSGKAASKSWYDCCEKAKSGRAKSLSPRIHFLASYKSNLDIRERKE
jgi:hypothetical protein